MASSTDEGAPQAPGELKRVQRPNVVVWLLRIVTVSMLVFAIAVLWKRHQNDPAQEELVRYATLTVPGYLDELARLHALVDRLGAGGGLQPEQARTVLVDEVMPQIIRMRKRAETVAVESPAVHDANAEYVAALDAYLEMDRAGVRAIDDPATSGDEGHRTFVAKQHEADDGVRRFMTHLRERCQRAGIQLVPAGAGGAAPQK